MRRLQPHVLRWLQAFTLNCPDETRWWDKLGLKRAKTILEYLKKCIISNSGELLSASLLVRKGGWLLVLWTKLCPSKFALYRSSQHTSVPWRLNMDLPSRSSPRKGSKLLSCAAGCWVETHSGFGTWVRKGPWTPFLATRRKRGNLGYSEWHSSLGLWIYTTLLC